MAKEQKLPLKKKKEEDALRWLVVEETMVSEKNPAFADSIKLIIRIKTTKKLQVS